MTSVIAITYKDDKSGGDLDIQIMDKKASPTEFNIAKKMCQLFTEYSDMVHQKDIKDCSNCKHEKMKIICPEVIEGNICEQWAEVDSQ